jgi:hypothetical protein
MPVGRVTRGFDAIHDNVATKQDLQLIKQDLQVVKAEIEAKTDCRAAASP